MNPIIIEDAQQIIRDNQDYDFENLRDTTILITGANGMVGSYFVYTFLTLNEMYHLNIKILALVHNLNHLNPIFKEHSEITIINQDVCDSIKWDGPIDYIIHAAGPASPKIMKEKPVETNFANTLGTANTLKLAKAKQSKGYLFISSREIYGEPNENQELFTEDGPLGQVNPLIPRNGYAEGKKAAENMCASFREEYGLNTKIVRLAHTYGPGMSIYDGRVQADFLKNVIFNEDIIMKSEGTSIRTYTYIADAVSAMFRILFHSNDLVYNVADENCKTSIRGLAELLVDMNKDRGIKLITEIPANGLKGVSSFTGGILDTSRIRACGWEPKYDLKSGFARTIKYLESENK